MLKKSDRSLKFLEKFWRPFTSFDTQIWWSLIDCKFDVKKWWSITEVSGEILKTIYKFWHSNLVIDRKFRAKKSDRSLKFLEKFWRPFTSFDTQIWWSIANLVLKNSDRSLKFLEKFWRPFTSFDTQIWWSLINRKFDVKKWWLITEVSGEILKTIYKFWHSNLVIDRKFGVKKYWSIAKVSGKILKTIYKLWHSNLVVVDRSQIWC